MALPGILLAVCLVAVLAFVINDTNWALAAQSPDLTAQVLGQALLDDWALPFEMASVLLTAALVGAIMLVRTPEEEAEDALR